MCPRFEYRVYTIKVFRDHKQTIIREDILQKAEGCCELQELRLQARAQPNGARKAILQPTLILPARLPIEVLSNQPMITEALKQAASVCLHLNGSILGM